MKRAKILTGVLLAGLVAFGSVTPVMAEGEIDVSTIGSVDRPTSGTPAPTGNSGSQGNGNNSGNNSNNGGKYDSNQEVTNAFSQMAGSQDVIEGGETAGFMDEGADLEQTGQKIVDKTYEIADWIRKIGVAISVCVFVIAAIWAAVSALSKRATAMPAVVAMGISAVVFTVCYYAPQILLSFMKWLAG